MLVNGGNEFLKFDGVNSIDIISGSEVSAINTKFFGNSISGSNGNIEIFNTDNYIMGFFGGSQQFISF